MNIYIYIFKLTAAVEIEAVHSSETSVSTKLYGVRWRKSAVLAVAVRSSS
jgi:hypothetical protein